MKGNKVRSTIFVPVGTSLIGKAKNPKCRIYSDWSDSLTSALSGFRANIKKYSANDDQDLELVREISWKNWRDCFLNVPNKHAITFFDEYTKKVHPITEIKERKKGELNEYNPDKLTAELASLYLFYEELKQKGANSAEAASASPKDEIILLASDTDQGLYCACFLADYLMHTEPYKEQIGEVHVERIIGLVGDDSDTFGKQGLDNIISQATELIKERQDKRQLYLNVTGGYKGVLPYLVLLGLAFGKMDVFYLFELSDKIVWLPKLPVGFDLLSWRNYRVFIRSIPHIKGLEEKDLEALIPATMRTLLVREKVNNKFSLTALGKNLHDQYEGERGKEISEYGRGYLLTDEIKDPQKQQALRDCINRWQYLWLGDLIPETVEHARGHTQRVLELAAQILYPILSEDKNFFGDNPDQRDNNLIALISAIWLHDLGHSGDYMRWKNDNTEKPIEYEIKGFPSLIRELHHFLSWYRIDKDGDKLFESRDKNDEWVRDTTIFSNDLIESIRLICLYHRGGMPVLHNEEKRDYVGLRVKKSLEELRRDHVNIPLLAALLRIADGGDVQEERTISSNYRAMRSLQKDRELETLKKEETKYREKVDESQLPDYLRYLKETASKYFNGESLKRDAQYEKITNISGDTEMMKKLEELKKENKAHSNDALIDYLTIKCIQKYIQGDDLNDLGDTKIVLRNWLSALDQYVFKNSTESHFNKHGGISAVMYLPDKPKSESSKNEYHCKVLAIHKEGKDDGERDKLIENVEKVLTGEIRKEYEKVKDILNKNHIFFDTYWKMEEGGEEMKRVYPE